MAPSAGATQPGRPAMTGRVRSVTQADLTQRDVALRRSAARTLARTADPGSRDLLFHGLTDEDASVVAWSTFGLGRTCRGDPSVVPRVVARSASWLLAATPPGELDADFAFADTLARCGSLEAEITLRAWLALPAARPAIAARALAKLAFRRRRLEDASWVGLLDAASRSQGKLPSALLAFGELDSYGEAIGKRLVSVAETNLADTGLGRALAVRALSRMREPPVPVLSGILTDNRYSISERVDAARGLKRAERPGRFALAAALTSLGPTGSEPAVDLDAKLPVLLTAVDSLTAPIPKLAQGPLQRLAQWPVPPGAAAQRVVQLRCAAAAALAGTEPQAKELRECDPDPEGRVGSLARITVLDRTRIKGPNLKRWTQLVQSRDWVVAEAALRLIGAHAEIPSVHLRLAQALVSPRAGVVVVASQLIAARPDRAAAPISEGPGRDRGGPGARINAPVAPHEAVISALGQALKSPEASAELERGASLLDAVGALQLLSLKPEVERACNSPHPSLRQHAERALRGLGESQRRCLGDDPAPEGGRLKPASPPLDRTTRLVFHTTAGVHEITLEPRLAPRAVAQIAALARAGFYGGLRVHRQIPGFLVQFGDPTGDGFGTRLDLALPSEPSPVPFDAFDVGVAESGPNSGATQLFVTLGAHPHLDGEFTRVGHASGGFDRLTVGDIIDKVVVVD